jgi:phosphoribosylformylglycinamidine synthase
MDVKAPGDLVCVMGETRDELGGGEFYQMLGEIGQNVPRVDPEPLVGLYRAFHTATKGGLLASAHAVTRGGLGLHLALTAMAGELGMDVDLDAIPASAPLSPSRLLYSESAGRFVVTVSSGNRSALEEIFSGLPFRVIGEVTEEPRFVVHAGGGGILMDEPVPELKSRWLKPFGGLV